MLSRQFLLSALLVVCPLGVFGQTIAPVPSDPNEIATGPGRPAASPEERKAALDLLLDARTQFNLHSKAPYDLKVSIRTTGATRYEGAGSMEEVYHSGSNYRWSVNLGTYTALRIYFEGKPYDDRPSGPLPLRISQVRHAILSPIYLQFANFKVRTVDALYRGTKVTCVLLASGGVPTDAPGRHWPEVEYCVDPATRLLQVYSEVPGSYVMYDYDKPVSFHGQTLAGKITFAEAGVQVAEAWIDSVTDATNVDPGLFTPSSAMKARGLGTILQEPVRTSFDVGPAGASRTAHFEPIEVRAVLSSDGTISEAQALQNDDRARSQRAVELASARHYATSATPSGAPVQREIFINVRFVSVAPTNNGR